MLISSGNKRSLSGPLLLEEEEALAVLEEKKAKGRYV